MSDLSALIAQLRRLKQNAAKIGKEIAELAVPKVQQGYDSVISNFYSDYSAVNRQGRLYDLFTVKVSGSTIELTHNDVGFEQGAATVYDLVMQKGIHGGIMELNNPPYVYSSKPIPAHSNPPDQELDKFLESLDISQEAETVIAKYLS